MFFLLFACINDSKTTTVEQVEEWCSASYGETEGTRSFVHDFARAQVGFSLFGPQANWLENNNQLSELLLQYDFNTDLLNAYAQDNPSLCFLEAQPSTSTETTLEEIDNTVFVTLGVQQPELPSDMTHIVIDLSQNPDPQTIAAVVGQILPAELTFATRKTRKFLGFPSQSDGWTHYESENISIDEKIVGTGESTPTLHFITPQRLAPETAKIVAGLRINKKAGLFGHNIFAATAESSWNGIENHGLLWRSSELLTDNTLWPDIIPVDLESTDKQEIYEAVQTLQLGDIQGDSQRSTFSSYNRNLGEPDTDLNSADMKSALLIGYGVLDWFYPYFDTVGRDIDAALVAELAHVQNLTDGDRTGFMHSMGRFMHSIHDGHGFYSDWGSTSWPDGYLGIQIQQIDGKAVIRDSLHPEIIAGDTITSIDGTPAAEWYEEAMSRYSATSFGYRFVLASDELKEVYGTKTLGLIDPQGNERDETVSGLDYLSLDNIAWGGTLRPSGWLEDLDSEDIFYVNLSGNVTPNMEEITDQIDSVMEANGIILDMRDYPYMDVYEFARYFRKENYSAPLFGFPTWSGPNQYELVFDNWTFTPAAQVYDGRIVLIVSNKSVSAAELFSQMITENEEVVVVGQQSASTNGTITNVWLPGQIQMTFTGMDLRNADGSNFHGIGIVPDIVVTPQPLQFAQGEDPELSQAIEVIRQ